MTSISKFLSFLFAVVFASNIFEALAGGHGGGGGGNGGLILMMNNNKRSYKYGGDMILFSSECGQGIIKDGGRKGKSIFALPPPCAQKKMEKKVEYMPVPVPMKEYVPVPVYKEKIQPVFVNMEMPKKSMDMSYGMDMDMSNGYGMGMDTKKSVIHMPPEPKPNNPGKVKKVIKSKKYEKSSEININERRN